MTFETLTPAEVYDHYLGPAIAEPFARALIRRAAPRAGQRVLDLACGTGVVAREVAPLVGTGGKVVALDISPAMLDVARSRPAPPGAMIEWRQGDATALDLPDQSFDFVFCQQGLQFFPDRPAALREMRRVLTSDGRAALSVWRGLEHHPLYEALFRAVARHFSVELSTLDVSFSLGRADDLRALVAKAGFQRQHLEACTLDVTLPLPAQFVRITVLGAATSIPAFARLDEAARSAAIDTLTRELTPVVDRHRHGDRLEFPMSTHVTVAS